MNNQHTETPRLERAEEEIKRLRRDLDPARLEKCVFKTIVMTRLDVLQETVKRYDEDAKMLGAGLLSISKDVESLRVVMKAMNAAVKATNDRLSRFEKMATTP